MPRIGDRYAFRINLGGDWRGPDGQRIAAEHLGEIVYINRAHRWFLVRVDLDGTELRECFKF